MKNPSPARSHGRKKMEEFLEPVAVCIAENKMLDKATTNKALKKYFGDLLIEYKNKEDIKLGWYMHHKNWEYFEDTAPTGSETPEEYLNQFLYFVHYGDANEEPTAITEKEQDSIKQDEETELLIEWMADRKSRKRMRVPIGETVMKDNMV